MGRDHERIGTLVAELTRDAEGGRFAEARETERVLSRALLDHFRIEEEIVYPVFDARLGLGWGPTDLLREEHRDLERALAMMKEALLDESVRCFREGLALLAQTLPEHHAKEERVLYPALDRMLSAHERALLCERLRRG
jgi:iron-sulfur cluster repair protein YtfE (RIC family)